MIETIIYIQFQLILVGLLSIACITIFYWCAVCYLDMKGYYLDKLSKHKLNNYIITQQLKELNKGRYDNIKGEKIC